MLNKIVEALKGRSDLAGWTVRHLSAAGRRSMRFRNGSNRNGWSMWSDTKSMFCARLPIRMEKQAVGSGDATLLPGEDIRGGD